MKFLLSVACVALAAVPAIGQPVVQNREPLVQNAFYHLPLTSVKPQGWLRRQLEIQAGGLSGTLDEFWPSLKDSAWRGGAGEAWERGPYYLDGLVPLAYLLGDSKLIQKVKTWVEWTLTHQRPDGSIGPEPKKGQYQHAWQATDWWPNMVMLKVLTQYHEATNDDRVLPLMRRYVAHQLSRIDEVPLKEWAIYRWGDEVVSLIWYYNRTGDENALKLARKLHEQGYDWKAQFADFEFTRKLSKPETSLKTHVVNNAMAMKTSATWSVISGDRADRQAIYQLFEVMDRYHLMPGGVHSGDEHYAGRSPVQGTELCAVVEGMYSLEHLLAIVGDPAFGDRLEKMTFNALPGTLSADMWSHQYDQQPNQVLCTVHKRDWTTNGPESNLFGLEPNFGCCTANMHQGWPKFAANLWMATPDGGLAAVAYAPSEVRAPVKGGVVTITEQTEYPFRDTVKLTVKPEKPARFPLVLRIPAWADKAAVRVNGSPVSGVRSGAFHRIERDWKNGDAVDIDFSAAVRVSRWYNDSIAMESGPLVFSLRIGEDWRRLRDRAPAADWEVHPTTKWNYALLVDEQSPAGSVEVVQKPVGEFPFSPEGAPLELKVKGRELPGWKIENGSAAPPPASPVMSSRPLETLTLIPYGSAKLRITEFPRLEK
jgi:DUF1680 family protein